MQIRIRAGQGVDAEFDMELFGLDGILVFLDADDRVDHKAFQRTEDLGIPLLVLAMLLPETEFDGHVFL